MSSRAASIAGVVLSAGLLAACGGGSSAKDKLVASGVNGSGEQQLLGDPTFQSTVRMIGISPSAAPTALGMQLGRRLRAIVTDSGRLEPASFRQPYQAFLRRLGTLSLTQFRRRYGLSATAIASRVGTLLGLLDARLNEGADPPPQLPESILASYGRRGVPPPMQAGVIPAIRASINGLLPAGSRPGTETLASFQAAYLAAAQAGS
jgi:hypothetical protein